uniref:Uncharacterized protein n=1 Tax=viral metagenome TaxID=1070528 RepID=A0A6H1ZY19_9ZZZZ
MSIIKNNKKAEKNLTKARDKKCESIAQEIIQIIARHNIDPKNMNHDDMLKVYGPVQKEINKLMKEKGLTISEVNYSWSVVQAVLDVVKNLSVESIQQAFEMAERKLFAVDNVKDVTLQNIDNVLLLN